MYINNSNKHFYDKLNKNKLGEPRKLLLYNGGIPQILN